jgi:hypothetical protein
MGKINLDLFEEIFGDGHLEVKFKPRHFMNNPSVAHENKKKEKDRRKCRKFKQKNFEGE